MSEELSNQLRWYVIHTYSGYENKVKTNIEKLVENGGLEEYIQEISVPMEEAVEIKNGVKKTVQRKKFPGYVLLKMIMNDDTWYVVRNTRGVTSFVGPGSKPVPLTDAEVMAMGLESVDITDIDIAVGDSVVVTAGAFAENVGTVKEINITKKTVTVAISLFGRETPMELDFTQVQPLVK
ncbi:MAG: transcription termination/antitermination protein NusG [Clostridia bacterium]|nr:transcription termination/antitermination protein NusG [Clostridia bacterium]